MNDANAATISESNLVLQSFSLQFAPSHGDVAIRSKDEFDRTDLRKLSFRYLHGTKRKQVDIVNSFSLSDLEKVPNRRNLRLLFSDCSEVVNFRLEVSSAWLRIIKTDV